MKVYFPNTDRTTIIVHEVRPFDDTTRTFPTFTEAKRAAIDAQNNKIATYQLWIREAKTSLRALRKQTKAKNSA